MSVLTIVVLAAILLLAVLIRIGFAWWHYRGARVVTCPETQKPAGVELASGKLAVQSILSHPSLNLSSCSRWPERAGCGQSCLQQIHDAPEDCLVRNIVVRWYDGKKCASCGRPFGEIPMTGAKPAVLRADKSSVEWNEIPAERLAETLAEALPICFACHMGNTLMRQHPDLVVDRQRPAVQVTRLGTKT